MKWQKILTGSCISLILLACGCTFDTHTPSAWRPAPGDILRPDDPAEIQPPLLHQEPRLDWVSVKDCGAKGDGVADDSAAIQSLYSRLGKPGEPRVAYFPPGKYRITKTLTIGGDISGIALIGHGRDSVLVWDGEKGGSMFWSNGIHRSRFEGLTYDGQGKAGIGSEHRSMKRYETHLIYESCSFLNLENGIAVSKNKREAASAEIWYRNCLFKNTGTGLFFGEFNDYDNWIDGCVFAGNDVGVDSRRGHFNVRNSHFIGSRTVDVRQGQACHPSSIRWSTSHGSKRFFETGVGRHNYPFTLQDNWVEDWTADDGAVRLGLRGPTLIMDNTFVGGTGKGAPIRMVNMDLKNPWCEAQAVLSGNIPPDVKQLLDPGNFSRHTSIPEGRETRLLKIGKEWFYRENPQAHGKVFDAKRDFGAKGDGSNDDTDAVQRTIDAARGHGYGAVAYLPFGQYKITRTLDVSGSDYTIESTGCGSTLDWKGDKEGVMMSVNNPGGITISHFSCNGPETVTFIRQTGHDAGSSVYYNNLHLPGCYPPTTGLELRELPAGTSVRIGFMTGGLRVLDSGQATVVGAVKLGRTVIEGGRLPKTGFTGLLYHNDVHREFALTVKDNQDLVVGDFYCEQNPRYLLCEGGVRPGPGHVTIGASKMSCTAPEETVVIRDYEGRICLTTGGAKGESKESEGKSVTFIQNGSRPVDLIVMATSFILGDLDPSFKLEKACRYVGIENAFFTDKLAKSYQNEIPDGGLESAASALDDFRRLGHANREMNYPE